MKAWRIARGLLFVAAPVTYGAVICVIPLHILLPICLVGLAGVCMVGMFLLGYSKW